MNYGDWPELYYIALGPAVSPAHHDCLSHPRAQIAADQIVITRSALDNSSRLRHPLLIVSTAIALHDRMRQIAQPNTRKSPWFTSRIAQ